jgi:ubiquitin-protein ligase
LEPGEIPPGDTESEASLVDEDGDELLFGSCEMEALSEEELLNEIESCYVSCDNSSAGTPEEPRPASEPPAKVKPLSLAPILTSLEGKVVPLTPYLFGLREHKILAPYDARKRIVADVAEIYDCLEKQLKERVGHDWKEHLLVKHGADHCESHKKRMKMVFEETPDTPMMEAWKVPLLDIWKTMDYMSIALKEAKKTDSKIYTNSMDVRRWSELQVCYKLAKGPFEGRDINVVLDIPEDYPKSPVVARTTRTLYHPQITHDTGEFMLWFIRHWTPNCSILLVLTEVLHCLEQPQYEGAINPMFSGIPAWMDDDAIMRQRKRKDLELIRAIEGGLQNGRKYGGLTALPRELQNLLPRPQDLERGEVTGLPLQQTVAKPKSSNGGQNTPSVQKRPSQERRYQRRQPPRLGCGQPRRGQPDCGQGGRRGDKRRS